MMMYFTYRGATDRSEWAGKQRVTIPATQECGYGHTHCQNSTVKLENAILARVPTGFVGTYATDRNLSKF